MTAPARNGGHGLIYAVATGALSEAEDLEKDATDLEQKAAEKRRAATALRALHGVAAPHLVDA